MINAYNEQRSQAGAERTTGPFERRQTLDTPVYFSNRSALYAIFDEVVEALPYFDPSDEQRYFCVEILIMKGGFNLVKVEFIFFKERI